jgi:TIR domain
MPAGPRVGWLIGLAGQFGAGVVFQDVDSIRPGDDFAAALEAAVGAYAVLLAVIGPQWLAGEGDAERRLEDPQDWVRLEIEAAIRRRVRIIPVLVDGARMPSASELPPSLQSLVGRQAVTLSPASLDTRSEPPRGFRRLHLVRGRWSRGTWDKLPARTA